MNTVQAQSRGDVIYCRASMNYMAPDGADGSETVATEVSIRDGRRAELPGWETCGFELMEHRAGVADWSDEAAIVPGHYQEMAELARALTGCDHALVSGHISRNPEQAAVHEDLAPISFVHSDFAANYGEVMRDFYRGPKEEAKSALARAGIGAETVAAARRMLILQFWRNVGPARMDLPLAFCDSRTVAAGELRPFAVTDYAGGGFDFHTLGVAAPDEPERHHWYVFPDMHAGEVVAFRTYDSDRVSRGEPFWTPHSAFADPGVAPGQPSRRSIELRAICLYL